MGRDGWGFRGLCRGVGLGVLVIFLIGRWCRVEGGGLRVAVVSGRWFYTQEDYPRLIVLWALPLCSVQFLLLLHLEEITGLNLAERIPWLWILPLDLWEAGWRATLLYREDVCSSNETLCKIRRWAISEPRILKEGRRRERKEKERMRNFKSFAIVRRHLPNQNDDVKSSPT